MMRRRRRRHFRCGSMVLIVARSHVVHTRDVCQGQRTADGLTTDRRTLLVLTQSVWPSSAVPSQRNPDGETTDRRILLVLSFDTSWLAVERRSEPAGERTG